jgi:hypothetical protein
MMNESQIPKVSNCAPELIQIRDWLAINKPFITQTDHHLGLSVE